MVIVSTWKGVLQFPGTLCPLLLFSVVVGLVSFGFRFSNRVSLCSLGSPGPL